MAYRAPADAFSTGLERGIGIHQQLFVNPERQSAADKRAQEEHDARMSESGQRVESSKATQARQDDADLLKLSTDELGDITRQHQAVIQQYGSYDKVPQEVASKIGGQYSKWQENHSKLLDRARTRIGGWVDEGRQTARDLSGGKPMSKVDNSALVNSIAVNTGMDPSDFLDGPNGPSPLRQAGDQIVKAGENGNWQEVVPAANVLLKAELRQGVGTIGRDGTPIVSKEIVGFVPAPNGTGAEVYPVLRVKTQGHPEGYSAPVTQDRSSDPNDPPITVSVSKLIDRLQHVSTLVETLNHPDISQKVQAGMAKDGDAIRANLDAFAQLPSGKRKTKTDTIDLGNVKRRETRFEDTGALAGEEDLPVGINPGLEARLGNLEKVAGIKAAASKDVGAGHDTARVTAAGVTQAGANSRAATRAAGAGKAQKLTEGQQNKMIEGEAGKYGIFKRGQDWKQWKGSGEAGSGKGYWTDLSPESMTKLSEIKSKVATSASPKAPGVAAGGGDMRSQAQAAIAKGADAAAVAARYKEQTGEDY